MAEKRSHRGASNTAVAVRIVAFFVGGLGVLAIPGALVAGGTGHASAQLTLAGLVVAAALISSAALAARSVDPLRG